MEAVNSADDRHQGKDIGKDDSQFIDPAKDKVQTLYINHTMGPRSKTENQGKGQKRHQ